MRRYFAFTAIAFFGAREVAGGMGRTHWRAVRRVTSGKYRLSASRLQFRNARVACDKLVREIRHENRARRRVRAAGDPDDAKIFVENIGTVLSPADAIIDDQNHDRMPRIGGAVEDVFTHESDPVSVAFDPIPRVAAIATRMSAGAARAAVDYVRHRGPREPFACGERWKRTRTLEETNGLLNGAIAFAAGARSLGDDLGVELRLGPGQIHFR